MTCRFLCAALQHHYLYHRPTDYVRILSDTAYMKAMNLTREESNRQIRIVWDKHLKYRAHDVMKEGKRVRNEFQFPSRVF